ncbi:MAG: sporulation protein [Micromonosporaceae bacterium]|nr:sporulation protein [Micromonosporaceae bacterium]
MVFKKMLKAFGVGGPTVDTVLANTTTCPGDAITGRVDIAGGTHDVDIEQVTVALTTRVEVESGDEEYSSNVDFQRVAVAGAFHLREGENRSIPFQLPVPWETPITEVYGQRLPGMTMGVRTELSVAKAIDKGDLDPISVHPLPSQQAILDAFVRLGFRFKTADLERGHIHGLHQTLPFYQEIEFHPAPQYASRINEVELTFIANPTGMDLVLEFDKRGGLITSGQDAFSRFTVTHQQAAGFDWTGQVDAWVRQATERRFGLF